MGSAEPVAPTPTFQKLEVSPEAQSVTDTLLKQNKAVDTILQTRGLDNPLNRIVATKVEALQQDNLDPADHLEMLATMIDNFNRGVLAAEGNSIDNNLYRDDAYYQMGASLVGKDNVNRNEVDGFNVQPEQSPFAKYDKAPPQHQLEYDPNFLNQTRQVPTHTFQSPVNKIKSARDAAAVVKAGIAPMAQENMVALVTDDDGNILNIIKHSLGSKDSASVATGNLVGSILGTSQAKKVWLHHNHPSGKVGASTADTNITSRLQDLLSSTGVKLQDHLIVGSNRDTYYSLFDDMEAQIDGSDIGIAPRTSTKTYPLSLTERMFIKNVNPEQQFTIDSPITARQAADDMEADTGIILLDNRNGVAGTLELSTEDMAHLRANDGEALRKVYVAIDSTNASAIIIKNAAGGTEGEAAARNLSRFLNEHGDLRVLDYLHKTNSLSNQWSADSEVGNPITESKGTFRSKNLNPNSKGQSLEELQREVGNLSNVMRLMTLKTFYQSLWVQVGQEKVL